jgi:hypothetical protein
VPRDTRIAGSSPSSVTMAAVSPISIGVRAVEGMGDKESEPEVITHHSKRTAEHLLVRATMIKFPK